MYFEYGKALGLVQLLYPIYGAQKNNHLLYAKQRMRRVG